MFLLEQLVVGNLINLRKYCLVDQGSFVNLGDTTICYFDELRGITSPFGPIVPILTSDTTFPLTVVVIS